MTRQGEEAYFGLEEQVSVDMEAMREPPDDFLADRVLAAQDVRDAALRRAVGQVLLLETVLFHQKTQYLARRGFGNLEILILVGKRHFLFRA